MKDMGAGLGLPHRLHSSRAGVFEAAVAVDIPHQLPQLCMDTHTKSSRELTGLQSWT